MGNAAPRKVSATGVMGRLMRTVKILVVAATTLCLPSLASAQLSEPCLDLDGVMHLAAAQNPRVATREAQLQGAAADLTEARSLFRPQISGFARTGAGDVGLIDSAMQNQVGLRASQRVFDFGDARLARETARHAIDASEYDVALSELEAASEVGSAVLDMHQAAEAITLTSSRRDYFERQLAAIDSVLDQGGSTRSERAEVAAQLANANAFVLELRAQYDRALTRIDIQTGATENLCKKEIFEADFASLGEQIDTIGEAVERALYDAPGLRAMRARVNSIGAESKRESIARLPIISVVGSAAYSQVGNGAFDVQERIGLDISVPFYTGNALAARGQRANARHQAAKSEIAEQRRQIEQDVRITFQNILSLQAQTSAARNFEDRSRELFEFAQIEYEVGRRTLPDLIDIRLEFEQASLQSIQTKFNLSRERLRLFTLTGGG